MTVSTPYPMSQSKICVEAAAPTGAWQKQIFSPL